MMLIPNYLKEQLFLPYEATEIALVADNCKSHSIQEACSPKVSTRKRHCKRTTSGESKVPHRIVLKGENLAPSRWGDNQENRDRKNKNVSSTRRSRSAGRDRWNSFPSAGASSVSSTESHPPRRRERLSLQETPSEHHRGSSMPGQEQLPAPPNYRLADFLEEGASCSPVLDSMRRIHGFPTREISRSSSFSTPAA